VSKGLLALLVGLVASAEGSTVVLTAPIQNVLTPIDSVPTQLELDTAFTDHARALQGLTELSTDVTTDTGIRLRAIHALTRYCATSPCVDGDLAHLALVSIVEATKATTAGPGVVVLRGAIEALGPQRVGTDLPLLVPLLEHQSRDVRAATVHALRDLCNTQAINPLRALLQHETTDQVRLAISEALRILGQAQPCQ
jgi:HEAT repeat protein